MNHSSGDGPEALVKDPSAFTALTKIHKKAVTSCCFSPDTNQILTGGEDNAVVLWNIPDHQLELHDETINDEHKIVCYRLSDHEAPITSVAISESYFVSASKDGQAKLWRLAIDKQTTENPNKCPVPEPITYNCHSKIVRSVAISPYDNQFATGSDDKTVKIWSSDCRNKRILSLCDDHSNWIKCVQWSKLNPFVLASCGDDCKLCLWDTRAKSRASSYSIITARKQLNCLDWHPVFGHHIATGSQDSSCVIWDLRNGKQAQVYIEHSAAVNSVQFSTSGSLLLTGSADKSAKIFDVCEGIALFTLKSHQDTVSSVCFNNDDSLFATSSHDKATTIWKKNFDAVSIELEHENDTEIYSVD